MPWEEITPEKVTQPNIQNKSGEWVEIEQTPKERSLLEQAGRLPIQFGVGLAEKAALPYEILVAPLAIPGGQESIQDLFTRDILSDVYPEEEGTKAIGVREKREPINLGVRSLLEKTTGMDLKPEGYLEKAAGWAGFIKDPKNIKEIAKSGVTAKEITKSLTPTGKEAARALTTGAALQLAEDGEFGPIGTLAATLVGDLTGYGVASGSKLVKDLFLKPKQTLAELAAKFTVKDKLDLQKKMIDDFRKSGIQADIGTLTDSNLVKLMQARLAESGLTGKALEDLKSQMTNQIESEYKAIADNLGQAKFATTYEAGQVAKDTLTKIRDNELAEARKLYQKSQVGLSDNAYVNSSKIAKVVDEIERDLKPGSLKSTEQKQVLDVLSTIKRDLYDSEGNLLAANVRDLINTKIALNDIINYEIQGGQKQLLKQVVGEIDRAIISHGKKNSLFAKNYIKANQQFSNYAKTFRNKQAINLLKEPDPEKLLNRMNSVHGIRDLEKTLGRTKEGREVMNSLKRIKLDQMIGNNLIDSTTKQVKFGTFSKLLDKGKNRTLSKELLGEDSFKRLDRLHKNVGRLSETAQKFYNASKSGTTIADMAIVAGIAGKAMSDVTHLLGGNPWPLTKTAGGIMGAKYITNLIADPEFLKLTEEAILASSKNKIPLMMNIGEKMSDIIKSSVRNIK